jgi:phosphate transport system ATP-binding protein
MNTKNNKIAAIPAEVPQQVAANDAGDISLHASKLSLVLEGKNILRDISFSLPAQGINILIGPSGAGKSTLLRCLNLLHTDWCGELRIMGHNARCWPEGEDGLRRTIGLIAQKPTLFPCSIQQNIVFGLSRTERNHIPENRIEKVLKQAALWDEVKTRLHDQATTLSVGQQQRLCIARALMLSPKMLLLDEPTASLDPLSKQFIEASLLELAQNMPVLCVTHDIEQAKRLGGQIIFMCEGHLIESGDSKSFFKHPNRIESREFLRWSVCDCS